MNKDNPSITIDDIVNDTKRYLTEEEIEKLKDAYKYASIVHKNQKRLSGVEYIKHPLNVVHILSKLNADSDTLIAGMLHDTISVGGIKSKDISSRFGDEVANPYEDDTENKKKKDDSNFDFNSPIGDKQFNFDKQSNVSLGSEIKKIDEENVFANNEKLKNNESNAFHFDYGEDNKKPERKDSKETFNFNTMDNQKEGDECDF